MPHPPHFSQSLAECSSQALAVDGVRGARRPPLALPTWLVAPSLLLDGRVAAAQYLGAQTLYRISTAAGKTIAVKETRSGERRPRAVGDLVGLAWRAEDAVVLEG